MSFTKFGFNPAGVNAELADTIGCWLTDEGWLVNNLLVERQHR
jgi:hypothetical protein